MNTTIRFGRQEFEKMKSVYGSGLSAAIRKKIDTLNSNVSISEHVIETDKKLFPLSLSLEQWQKLNHWIIDCTTEHTTYDMRNAILTLIETDVKL